MVVKFSKNNTVYLFGYSILSKIIFIVLLQKTIETAPQGEIFFGGIINILLGGENHLQHLILTNQT